MPVPVLIPNISSLFNIIISYSSFDVSIMFNWNSFIVPAVANLVDVVDTSAKSLITPDPP